MKKGDIIELYIEDFDFPNTGIGYINGIKVKVDKTLKGQRVKARIVKKNKERIIAKAIEIIEKANYEIKPACIHFGECGGCFYQPVPYEMQIELKGANVKKLLNDKKIWIKEFQGVEGSPDSLYYRNKMEYTFGDEKKGGEMTLGMHKKGSFMNVVTTDHCKLVHPDFNLILYKTLKYFTDRDYPFYHKKSHIGLQRNLIIRKGENTKELLINLVTTSQIEFDKDAFVSEILDLSLENKVVGIVHTINDGVSDFVYCDSLETLWGRDYYFEEILGLTFKISPFSFFQTNTQATEKLYATVLEYVGEAKHNLVFDLYSGTGTIGQVVALKAQKVIGVELVEEAVKVANENAKLNQLENCSFIAGDVFEQLEEINDKPDLIILDPPRVGVGSKALNKILGYGVENIIYVSCNPKSLAENLSVMQESGYTAEKVKVFDNFPHTGHVESVVLLSRDK